MHEYRQIPYVNLAKLASQTWEELLPALQKIIASGKFILGEEIEKLEEEIAHFCDVKYCIALNSGTDALILSLKVLGIGPKDEVITPPNSFAASTASIVHVGATPIFADVLEDQNIDPLSIEKKITPRTKAIMPVHLTGRICQMDKIMNIAKKHNLLVIEDAAQSIGSTYQGKKSGSFGVVGCFSAHPLKNLNAFGDAGFVTTSDSIIANRLKKLRNHGLQDKFTIAEWGIVSRMDTIQAVILRHHLTKLSTIIEARRKNASFYNSHIKNPKITKPICRDEEFNTFHTYVIQTDTRDNLKSYLEKYGIGTAIHYPVPIHLQPAAKNLGYKRGDFPITEKQADRILTLPINQLLQQADLQYVCEVINSYA